MKPNLWSPGVEFDTLNMTFEYDIELLNFSGAAYLPLLHPGANHCYRLLQIHTYLF